MSFDWPVRKLGDLSDIAYGYTEKASSEPIGPKFLRITDIQNDAVDWDAVPYCKLDEEEHERHKLVSGDIVFARTGATTGKSYMVSNPPDAVCASYLIRLRLRSSELLPEFVSYYFSTKAYWDAVSIGISGSAQGGFNASKLNALRIPLPALTEQRRIVAILDEAFAGLATATANAEKNLKNARELFESRLSRVFNKIAQQNGSRRLGEIVTRLTNGYVGPTRNIYLRNGVPYLLARHVRDNQLEFDGKTFVSYEFNEKNKKSKLKAGDVLLVQSGHIGHSAVVGPEHEGHNCHAMIVITPVLDEMTGDFLSYYFCSAEMKRKFKEIRSGSIVPHLTCGLIRELMIPLPRVVEQRKIVADLQSLEHGTSRLASAANEKIVRLGQLRQSILQKAFSGELTSPPSQAIKEAAE